LHLTPWFLHLYLNMLVFYSSLFYLLIPFVLIRLLWRSIKAPAYRSRWNERFGFYNIPSPKIDIWFHAVSVGEVEALFPLVRKIQQKSPDKRLLVTTTTPTGSARVTTILKESVEHVYLPYDIPVAVNRFMKWFKPQIAVVMETEIWPNLFVYCGKNKIPLYIFNARLSEKSSHGYQKIPALIRLALAQVKLIGAQTRDDADRFIAIGANHEKVKVLGNLKFDVEIPQVTIDQGRRLKADLFTGRFVWLIASTHKDEEAIFLEICKSLKEKIPNLLLLIVPRHPERFREVEKLCLLHHFNVVMRTSGNSIQANTDVYLVDTMGELKMLYAAADVAFVGGSMVNAGGHNILEASAVGVPVMFGPYMANFKEIASGIVKQNAAIQCRSQDEISDSILTLYAQPAYRHGLVEKGKIFLEQNQGSIAGIYSILDQGINKAA